ncbi:MAG: hypothetical protein KC561_07025, partial [Myxococcales bacterium]|nr:hypothetical protein [Myxococcales bacterium]
RLESIESRLTEIVAARDRASGEGTDVAQIRCLNDKVSGIQGYFRLASEAQTALEAASNDLEDARHQYSMIVIASGRVSNLANEASQCSTDILTFTGPTNLQATVDDRIPDDTDQTSDLAATDTLDRLTDDDGAPLPEATPFQ